MVLCRLVNVAVGVLANHTVYGLASASQPLSWRDSYLAGRMSGTVDGQPCELCKETLETLKATANITMPISWRDEITKLRSSRAIKIGYELR